jgi:hypothetical protein
VDEYNERLTQPLRDVWLDYPAGRASVLDLSRVAEQVLAHLDHAHAPLLDMLRAAESSLEAAWWGSADDDERRRTAEQHYMPMLAYLDTH